MAVAIAIAMAMLMMDGTTKGNDFPLGLDLMINSKGAVSSAGRGRKDGQSVWLA